MPELFKKFLLIGLILISSGQVFSAFNSFTGGGEKLRLKNPSVEELNAVCEVKSVERLIIKGRVEGAIPECLKYLTALIELELNEVNPNLDFTAIAGVQNLQTLRIKHIEIAQLPDFILEMISLRFLDISGTEIKSLPYGLDFLEKIDMRMIELNREEQEQIREQYPETEILFSSPCQCG